MTEMNFGRQLLPVTVTISEGEETDRIYWFNKLKRASENAGDLAEAIALDKDFKSFRIYPRANND